MQSTALYPGTEFDIEFRWLSTRYLQLINSNPQEHFTATLPDWGESPYSAFIVKNELSSQDRILVSVALTALLSPNHFSELILNFRNPKLQMIFGGRFSEETGRFIPTLRSALFALAGFDTSLWAHYLNTYTRRHALFTSGLLLARPQPDAHAFADADLVFNEQFLPSVLYGQEPILDGDAGFPARRSKKKHTLTEVVLAEDTLQKIEKLSRFARQMQTLWNLPQSHKYRQNYICIFSGEPGTGKSHTAEAIGNELGLPVYKVNFAQLTSKYIGETEKNLERVFDRFSGQPGILFFDEAEAVFSKRVEVTDAHDKHANNEQSFLLQKIEEFSGIVILATNVQNLTQYFDKAFQRRIRQIIAFNFPDYPERLRIWNNALARPFEYEPELVERLARNYQLSGGNIYNVISEAVVDALDQNTRQITFELIEPALQDEFRKSSRKYETCTDEQIMQNPARRYGPGYEHRRNY
jgi:AAA+ superfamily predicted ATPase